MRTQLRDEIHPGDDRTTQLRCLFNIAQLGKILDPQPKGAERNAFR